MQQQTPQSITDFINSLLDSSLPDERKKYWLFKLEKKSLTPQEFDQLQAEISTQINELKQRLIANKQQQKALESEVIAFLNQGFQSMKKQLDQRLVKFRSQVNKIEDNAFHQLQKVEKKTTLHKIKSIKQKLFKKQ